MDGLQPEKGHATLSVVRDLERKRVWFAEALRARATAESQQRLAQARAWAERLGKPVRLWMSDKQEACVRGSAAEFPGVPHRYGTQHFLRDVAKPIRAAESHAKVKMRRTGRGWRAIAREVLSAQRPADPRGRATVRLEERQSTAEHTEAPQDPAVPAAEVARAVGLEYCAAVRGILHDDQGAPLPPPGRRMAAALGDVQASLQRHRAAQQGGRPTSTADGWPALATEG